MSEDITFCANKNCKDKKCDCNPKRIRLAIPHSFALMTSCPKWSDKGAEWLTRQIKGSDSICYEMKSCRKENK